MTSNPDESSADTAEEYLQIEGGSRLEGAVEIQGAKNAALPAIVAACLSRTPTILRNAPTTIADMKVMTTLLRQHGASIEILDESTLRCDGAKWSGGSVPAELSGKFRHSLLALGLSAYHRTPLKLSGTGGCQLGARRHDMHASILSGLGYHVVDDVDFDLSGGPSSTDAALSFYYPSFGATLNFLTAAVGRPGVATLQNAAVNPEVQDVIHLLQAMGADIRWEGDGRTLRVAGGLELTGVDYSVMGDRIYASTIVAAAAVSGGRCDIVGVDAKYLEAEVRAWRSCGLTIETLPNRIRVTGGSRLKGVDVETSAYPGFHTDIQPLHGAMMSLASGVSCIKETILDNRFLYCAELAKMGADVRVEDGGFRCVNDTAGKIAIFNGVERLNGADVQATDIRGGAAVVIAALAAEGTTRITNLYQLDRGYSDLHRILQTLGGSVQRHTDGSRRDAPSR